MMHCKRIACDEEEVNEFAEVDAALKSLKNADNAQNHLSNLESCIQDQEEGLESLFRQLIKTRLTVPRTLSLRGKFPEVLEIMIRSYGETGGQNREFASGVVPETMQNTLKPSPPSFEDSNLQYTRSSVPREQSRIWETSPEIHHKLLQVPSLS
ncbi:hypothetical protein ACLB2K_020075 [Fragaria x ananassa]